MRIVTVVSLTGLMMLAGCTSKTGNGLTDSDLVGVIKAKLATNPDIQNANLGISANASKNEATLTGTVPTEDLRLQAVELARSSQPNLVVTDKIDVKPTELTRADYTDDRVRRTRDDARAAGDRIGSSADDAWIYSKIKSKMTADSDLSALRVNVDVDNKVVTLRGHVGSAQAKKEAERIAKDTDGVKTVHNQLSVAPAG